MAKDKVKEIKDIVYYDDVIVTCNCGATHKIGSTESKLEVEICSNCHPFYTGNQNFVDAAGRLEKFKERVALGEAHKAALEKKKSKKIVKTENKKESDKSQAKEEKTN